MEKKAKILVLGDSIGKGLIPVLEKRLMRQFQREQDFLREWISLTIPSQTSRGALNLLETAAQSGANVALIILGMNDWRKGVSVEEYEMNIHTIIRRCLDCGMRCIAVNIHPDFNGPSWRFSLEGRTGTSREIPLYNRALYRVCKKLNIRLANSYDRWLNKFPNVYMGLEDAIHPSPDGYSLIAETVVPVLVRTQMLVLWQFNGRYAHCNYSCPYCYVPSSVNKGMHFNFTMEKWEDAFLRHFGGKHTVFYLSYGEPMIANEFPNVIEMVGRHPEWEVKLTSNVSLSLDRLLSSRVAKERRLNVNASFHPTQTTLEKFVGQCDRLRNAGIEPSVVYVMYPPQIDEFMERYMPVFRSCGYVVHVRAFRGLYRAKKYPGAYTELEWIKTARYMDMANLKYQMGEVSGLGRLSMLGVSHILVDNFGKIEMCDSYVGDRHYGNLWDEKIHLDVEPKHFPGLVPLAAVDDIADYVELSYNDLTGNNILSYARQGGVFKKGTGEIVYALEHFDFTDKKKRDAIMRVPAPQKGDADFWLNVRWFIVHFLYSLILKKYGKWAFAWIGGKYRLIRRGRLTLKNFWHG